MKCDAIRLHIKLCAEALWLPFEYPNSIINVSVLPPWHPTVTTCVIEQLPALPHEGGLADRVLCNQPGGFGAIDTGQGRDRPSMCFDDCAQSVSIVPMHLLHTMVITVEKRTVSRQPGANVLIMCAHCQKL